MMGAITKFRLKMKLFLCVLAIALCATSGLNLSKSTKEKITRAPLIYDKVEAHIQIYGLCSTVCNQYSEEYLKLKNGPEPVVNDGLYKAREDFVTCHMNCVSSIEAQLKSLQ
ncbi:hypothetical protein T08_10806 [Trichinella sp. T8]|nr:hypothetical protein T08_10806 [Trichinella sp. T8]